MHRAVQVDVEHLSQIGNRGFLEGACHPDPCVGHYGVQGPAGGGHDPGHRLVNGPTVGDVHGNGLHRPAEARQVRREEGGVADREVEPHDPPTPPGEVQGESLTDPPSRPGNDRRTHRRRLREAPGCPVGRQVDT